MKNIFKLLLIFLNLLILGCRDSNKSLDSRDSKNNQTTEIENTSKPDLNFYIEDGGSMHGYFTNDTSMLKNDLPKILSISENLNRSNLHFIRYSKKLNKCIIRKNIAYGENEILERIDKLNEQSFKVDIEGGSGFKSIFETILKNQNKNEVVGLLSDFIPAGEFNNLEAQLNSFLKEKLAKDSTFSIGIIKLKSRFRGKYFRKNESTSGFDLNQLRPYYIWFFGSQSNLRKLQILNFDFCIKNLSGFENNGVALFTNQNEKIDYSILTNTFNENAFSQDVKNTETNSCKNILIKKDVKRIKFAVAINLSNIITDENYIRDTSKYIYSRKHYTLVGVYPIENNEIIMGDSTKPISTSDLHYVNKNNAKYILLFESKQKPTDLEFSLKKGIPTWLKESESSTEEYIDNNKLNHTSAIKTLGYQDFNNVIKYNFINEKLNNGVKYYFTCKIGVEQQKGSFILKLILFLVLGFVIFYFYKRFKNN